MIRTIAGAPITVIGGDLDAATLRIRYESGRESDAIIPELRADGGMLEITEALKKVAPVLTGGRLRSAVPLEGGKS